MPEDNHFRELALDGVKPEYAEFIRGLLAERLARGGYQHWNPPPKPSDLARAQCHPFSTKLVAAFPHLKLERGFYVVKDRWGDEAETEHWWAVDEDGTIVDPSKMQFHDQGGRYSPYEAREFKALKGRCPNCGGDIYEGDDDGHGGVCSEECADSYRAYIELETRSARR